jgi:PAS domain S-box-containing protein
VQAPHIDENLFQYLIEGVKDYAIFALDISGHIVSWNPGAERIKGYKAEEVIGKHFSIFYTEEAKDQGHPDFAIAEALAKGSYKEEGVRVRKDGTLFQASIVISPLYDKHGKHLGFAKVTRDLTERQKTITNSALSAQSLETSENAFNLMIAAVKDYAIFSLSPEGIIQSWNAGAERIKGYTAEEAIGRHFSLFFTQEAKDRKHPEYELEQAIKNGSYEEEGWRLRKDGGQIWVSATITPVRNAEGKGTGFVKVTRDLSERRAAESAAVKSAEALEESESAFNLMTAAVKDYAIFLLSPEGIIQSWNAGAERIKGYKAKEAIGRHFSIFYTQEAKDRKHPEYELEQAIKNGSYEEEGWRVRKDGSQIWVSVTITPVIISGGVLKGFVKVTRDLTERKHYEKELEQARDDAVLANALKSKFVANVTHEIRTPLSGVVGLSQLIAQDTNLDQQNHESAIRIFEASKQLLVILNDLLDFAKLEAGKVEIENVPYDVSKVIDDVVGLAKPQAQDKKLSISVTIDSQVPNTVIGDPNKLRQVLNNLIHNAIKFTEIGGIDVFVEKQDESLFFSVTDTGIGIAPETQDKLFKPFVQAHESTTRLFGGTGLGLSIAQQLIELMGGTLGLVSEPGQGATIWFVLPLKSSLGEAR